VISISGSRGRIINLSAISTEDILLEVKWALTCCAAAMRAGIPRFAAPLAETRALGLGSRAFCCIAEEDPGGERRG